MKRIAVLCIVMTAAAGFLFAGGNQEEGGTTGVKGGAGTFQAGDITAECRIAGEKLNVTLTAPTEGWIAVGFQPSSMMKDANIIIGSVDGDTVTIEDHFGTSAFAHKPDTDLGGSRDVEAGEGSEAGGTTTFSFAIPLDSGDSYDAVLRSGDTVKVILAYAKKDGFGTKHSYRTSAEITLE